MGNATDEFYVQVGKRIRDKRGAAMTQEKLAIHVGLTRTSVTNIEKGKQRLSLHTLIAIAEALKIPPAELLPSTIDGRMSASEALKHRPEDEQEFLKSALQKLSKGAK